MNRKEPGKDPLKDFAIKGFLALLSLLMSIASWFIIDMHSDVKMLMLTMPELKIRIDHLEVGRAKDQLRVLDLLPKQGKHEEEISFDSLTQNKSS